MGTDWTGSGFLVIWAALACLAACLAAGVALALHTLRQKLDSLRRPEPRELRDTAENRTSSASHV